MSDPQSSQYDPNPIDPNAKGGDNTPDPDSGKNLYYLVPDVHVRWSTPPSFNEAPPGQSSGASPTDVADSGPINFDAGGVRAVETTMLGRVSSAVDDYEALRTKSLNAAQQEAFFGVGHKFQDPGEHQHHDGGFNGGVPTENSGNQENNQIADMAKTFADQINPTMEKALWQIGNALETVGQYITMINTAGQTYAQVDRAARFPEPPA
ncbi:MULTISPECIES: hypothetical protein [Streptomyces]|uniref:hypothetical protein n=1 Tax=Streptomyces TaxID=1883 RepID=UPI0023DD0251|nr:hypothetical protein [Streptomyces sp. FXJ1.172]WEP00621.1 hypothetical protein A6P39_043630 [Streptomyces sp. FXJ1.172]